MDTNKILSASWLDILFDNRNKAYGAYELRKTYEKRIFKSLILTTGLTVFILAASSFSRSPEPNLVIPKNADSLTLTIIQEQRIEEPEPEMTREKPAQESVQETEAVSTEVFTEFVPVPDIDVIDQPPSQADLRDKQIGLTRVDGDAFKNIAQPALPPGNGTGIAETREMPDDDPRMSVQVQAKFIGNWTKFLLKYLDGNVPVYNEAPPGRYTVLIQFIVDKEGNVSEIKPLTHFGYGMEEEAIRVIKKATKWEPAIQSGFKVKAYRQQPITFEVLGD